jgi:hypothetical protein
VIAVVGPESDIIRSICVHLSRAIVCVNFLLVCVNYSLASKIKLYDIEMFGQKRAYRGTFVGFLSTFGCLLVKRCNRQSILDIAMLSDCEHDFAYIQSNIAIMGTIHGKVLALGHGSRLHA